MVLANSSEKEPWFAAGLRFGCTQCGNCCTGGPGFVWVTAEEIGKIAQLLGLSAQTVRRKYCRKIGDRTSLKEIRRGPTGGYDCIFLKEIAVDFTGPDKPLHGRRVCSIYQARPLQCRTWPFWEGNLASARGWREAGRTCPGMDRGKLHSRNQIEALRDAKEWPR